MTPILNKIKLADLKHVVSYSLLICTMLCSSTNFFAQKIGGLTFVAPPEPVAEKAFDRIVSTNAKWISLVPYGFSKEGDPNIRFNLDWQWWGEKEDGIRSCIREAKSKGLKVMLKPQVYIHNSWVGYVDFNNESDWRKWEKGYEEFLFFFLEIAVEEGVDIFCIGTEYKKAIIEREIFWRSLIEKTRNCFSGKLTYSSNWDNYQSVPFWDDLDFIGISAYFPLTDHNTPDVDHLCGQWNPIEKELDEYSCAQNKPILFTEYGYLTTDKCAYRAWELEKQLHQLDKNEDAQANAFAALYRTFADEEWWAGGFIWKWFPEGMGHEGYPEKDYDPQDKKAESIIRHYYKDMQ